MDYVALMRQFVGHKLTSSIVLLFLTIGLRIILRRAILRNVAQPEVRLRWLIVIRNILLLVFIVGVVLIWEEALRTFAVAVTALAVAFVVATKELIQCASGSFVRTIGKAYSIGDRIEIANYRGDVIDHNVFTTTILEIGPGHSFHMHTGRTVVVPNSVLLTGPVVNESSMEHYIVHVFSIPLRVDEDWSRAEKVLLEAASLECGPFLEDARRHMDLLEHKHGFSSPSVEPRVAVQFSEPGRLNLLVRIPSPVGRQGRMEQAILRRFLDQFYAGANSDR